MVNKALYEIEEPATYIAVATKTVNSNDKPINSIACPGVAFIKVKRIKSEYKDNE